MDQWVKRNLRLAQNFQILIIVEFTLLFMDPVKKGEDKKINYLFEIWIYFYPPMDRG